MSEQNETKNVEEITSTQEVSPEDKKTEVIEDNVTISKKELEDLQKKANDFDGIIEKKRLEKLANKHTVVTKESIEEIDTDAIIERAKNEAREEALKVVQDSNRQVYENNLTQAYRIVKASHKWIDDDEIISNISKEFHPGSSLSVDDIVKKLEVTAANLYPDKYKSSLEESIKAKVLAQETTIQNAGGSGVTEPKFNVNEVEVTKEDQRIADKFFGGDVQRYLKTKK